MGTSERSLHLMPIFSVPGDKEVESALGRHRSLDLTTTDAVCDDNGELRWMGGASRVAGLCDAFQPSSHVARQERQEDWGKDDDEVTRQV